MDAHTRGGHRRNCRIADHSIDGLSAHARRPTTSAIRAQESETPRGRQGRRQQNNGDPIHTKPRERGLQVCLHVFVGGVHLVDDDDLAHQPEVTHQHVTRLQRCEQHLVDCADHDGRQG